MRYGVGERSKPSKTNVFCYVLLYHKNNNIDKTIQSHLDPDNEVTKALQQAKDSADLANETNKVKETLKTTAEDSLKDEDNLEFLRRDNKMNTFTKWGSVTNGSSSNVLTSRL